MPRTKDSAGLALGPRGLERVRVGQDMNLPLPRPAYTTGLSPSHLRAKGTPAELCPGPDLNGVLSSLGAPATRLALPTHR